jgi:aliphatic nitrilase
MQPLYQAAKNHNCHIVIGINERGDSYGEIYNTNLIIDNTGKLIGKHRKLVPTWAEKLTWTSGDGSSLKVYDTEIGPIGTLACGENTNTLARFTLLSQGELIHIANYISLPVAPPDYDMAEAIKIRAAAHSFEGKLFTIVSCSTISKEIMEALKPDVPNVEELLTRKNSAFSGIIGPNGAVVGQPLIDDEGIVYADIDLEKCIQPKQMHDILGHYNRFDIFDLRVNTAPTRKITFIDNHEEFSKKS